MKNELVDRENYTVTRNINCNIRLYKRIRRIRWDAYVGDGQNIFLKTSKIKISVEIGRKYVR